MKHADLGEIVNTVGLKGEIKLLPGPDFWPEALDTESLYLLCGEDVKRGVTVERSRKKKNTYILKFEDVDSIDQAEKLIGNRLRLTPENLAEEEFPGEILTFQLIGMEVELAGGEKLGRVVELIKGPGQDRIVVGSKDKKHIIPLVPEIVTDIDLEKMVMRIDPPEGLLDLEW